MVDSHRLLKEMKEYAESENVPIMMDEGINFLTNFILKKHVKSVLENWNSDWVFSYTNGIG